MTTLGVMNNSEKTGASTPERALAARSATLADVAGRAGVSRVAASVVLNPSGAGSKTRVSDGTRARILQAAISLGYTPNVVARSLRRQKTDVIGFFNTQSVIFDPTFPFYAAILAGIQDGCTDHNKDLHIHAHIQGRGEEASFLGLHNGQIDGMVLYARTLTPLVQRLVESRLPVVTIGEEIEGLPYVGIDESSGGQLLAKHLSEKGYQRVLYRSYHPDNIPDSHIERKTAFCQAADDLGLEVSHTTYDPISNLPTPEEEALILEARPEVVVCASDASADAIALICRKHGLRVPEDIALVGFDGLISTRRPALRLTTIQAPWRHVARTAMGLLAAQCAGQPVPRRTILPVKLLEGDTT